MSEAAIAIAEFGAEQWGLITAAQARELDVTPVQMKRLADRGALDRVHHGIYRMTRLPYDARQDLRTAWFALDLRTPAWERLSRDFPGGVVSHRSAAALLDLGDLDADITEFTCRRRVRLGLPDVHVHIGQIDAGDWTVVDGLPTTTALRTVVDLAGEGIDGGHLAAIVRDALTRELVSLTELQKALAPFAFEYAHALGDGSGFLDSLIAQAGVSKNITDLADVYRRLHENTTAYRRTADRPGVSSMIAAFDTVLASQRRIEDPDSDHRILPFDRVASTGQFDTPAMQAARQLILQSLETPALEAIRTSIATAFEPIVRQATENIAAMIQSDPDPETATEHDYLSPGHPAATENS